MTDTLVVEHANGTTSRWAGDETDAGNVPTSLQHSTAIPGGFTTLQTELLRNLNPRADEALFDTVKLLGPGGVVYWEGRNERLPRTNLSLAPAAVGWSSHLKDDNSFREIYVDHDLSRWGGPPLARQVSLVGSNYSPTAGETAQGSTSSALVLTATADWSATALPACESWYDAQGIPLGSIYYSWSRSASIDYTDTKWGWAAYLSSDDALTSYDGSSLRAAGPSTGTLTATTSVLDFAAVSLYFTGAVSGFANLAHRITWDSLKVYGRHGLTKQSDGGLLGSDIVRDIVGRAAPLLDTSGIEATSYSIGQAAFLDPVNAETAIATVNAYHSWEWGCWENKQFFFRQTDPDRTVWNVRLSEGATLALEGDNASEVVNGVIVKYTNGLVNKSVGPTAATNTTYTSALLEDTTASNPATAHGIRRWDILELSNPVALDADAVKIGQAYLAEKLIADRHGTVTLTGTVEKRGGSRFPVCAVRAGDYLTVADRPDEPVRRIIATTCDHAGGNKVVTCEVGNRVNKVDSILARLDAQLAGQVS